MDHAKKLEFIHKMTKMGLEHVKHFDGGGVISGGNSNPLSAVSGALTAQNSYTANAPTSAATIGTQQAGLATQLQNESAGNGPNPAQMQYEQNADQIAKQQAALNAQNRALNPGLAARQSSNAAVSAGQQAAGTAGAQEAEQQLAAQGQLEGLTGQEQTGLGQAEGINSQVSQNNTNAVQNTQGGILSSLPLVGSLFAKGGEVREVKKYATGGSIFVPGTPTFSNANNLPDNSKDGSSDSAPSIGSNNPISAPTQVGDISSHAQDVSGIQGGGAAGGMDFGAADGAAAAAAFSKGGSIGPQSHAAKWLNNKTMKSGGKVKGTVPAMVSPGEEVLSPSQARSVAKGKADPMKVGEKIQGHAKVKGDSYKNDTVPKMLKDGGMVLPRSIVQMHPDRAAAFVRNHLSKKGLRTAA